MGARAHFAAGLRPVIQLDRHVLSPTKKLFQIGSPDRCRERKKKINQNQKEISQLADLRDVSHADWQGSPGR